MLFRFEQAVQLCFCTSMWHVLRWAHVFNRLCTSTDGCFWLLHCVLTVILTSH